MIIIDLLIGSFFLHISAISLILVTIYIIKTKYKVPLHYAFLANMVFLSIWTISFIVELYYFELTGNLTPLIGKIKFIGICLIPVSFLFTGITFSKTILKRYYLLFIIIPLISLILVWTNEYHHLFFVHYSIFSYNYKNGPYFKFHAIYSYLCLIIGMVYFITFSIKNSGLFSKQALLLILSTLTSIIINILTTLEIIDFNINITSITFSFVSIIVFFAIFKFDFLNIIPIALRTVVNNLSDAFIVVSKDYLVFEYNQPFIDKILKFFKYKNIKYSLIEKDNCFDGRIIELKEYINNVLNEKKSLTYEKCYLISEAKKYFLIEITPLFNKTNCIGTLVFFKDITETKNKLNSLKEKNIQLDKLNTQLRKQYEFIESLNKSLKELSEIDELTGAYNRRFFNHYYEIETLRSKNQIDYNIKPNNITNFGIAIIDIDNFKIINDSYGHIVGDSVLKQLVEKIKCVIFSKDILCRYGGEEFVVIFTKTSTDGIIKASEKIRETIAHSLFNFDNEQKAGYVTISVGIATFEELADDFEKSILRIADDRLLKAKSLGKNRIIFNDLS